jgi:hypothetical protein
MKDALLTRNMHMRTYRICSHIEKVYGYRGFWFALRGRLAEWSNALSERENAIVDVIEDAVMKEIQ